MKWLVMLVLAGCGRFGFEDVPVSGDGAIDGDGSGSGGPSAPLLVPVGDNALDSLIDIAFDPSGGFGVTGQYGATLTLGGMSATTTSSAGFDMYAAAFDATGAPRWLWSANTDTAASGENLAWLPDGRLYIVGYFGGTLANANNINAGGGQDALQLWLTPTGTLDNATHQGGSSNVQMRALSVAGNQLAFGGIYSNTVDFGQGALTATGAGIDNAYLAAGDVTNGVTLSKSFNGGNDVYVNDVAIDSTGRICFAGRFNTTTDFGGGPVSSGGSSGGYVAMYDPGMTFKWARVLNSTVIQSVGFATNGDCVAGGYAHGNFTLDGLTDTFAGGAGDGFVMRFAAADGHAEWLQTIASAGDDTVFALATYDQDRVAIAGYFAGSAMVLGTPMVSDGANDGFVIGLDAGGNVLWTQLLAGSGSIPNALAGMDVDLTRRRLGIAAGFNGELRVGSTTQTSSVDTGIALVLPLPP